MGETEVQPMLSSTALLSNVLEMYSFHASAFQRLFFSFLSVSGKIAQEQNCLILSVTALAVTLGGVAS